MNHHTTLLALLGCALAITACSKEPNAAATACGTPQYQTIEAMIHTGDGMGHGPDIGSSEWKSVIERKLGIWGNPNVPAPDAYEWCSFIEQHIKASQR